MFKAEIIADSKGQFGNRITTFIVTFPRIILAEFNTHRMLSRNSASSRAIPFEKMLKSVEENPFIPIKWMKDHKGMQGSEYLDEKNSEHCNKDWLIARDCAIGQANFLAFKGVTKQFVNRLLEPFMWHTVIVTATEWENFFALRANPAAEIHMQKIAYMMLEEYNKSEPKQLNPGEWHIPFNEIFDRDNLHFSPSDWEKQKIKVSTAQCARVSYTVVGDNKTIDWEKDIELHDKLLQMGHMSPFEHCAQCWNEDNYNEGIPIANFIGFTQYRKMIEGENKSDSRVIKK